ncbi:drug resistance transporter, EmrB/QacA subfamily [Jiangella alba]|uniref:Drug resistance transporter, EmrB/QacA subfamily n=1 Tax=Jiangella alba TaxID=561176 RepID=A0A1H5MDJ6_9ACTN|nr:DHA2 family efflux MFS transporter permease subunit [Jiangella alba]SEE87452.1 drug resistance transporter, EmrB/QacA subfamily [Jiangella alba]
MTRSGLWRPRRLPPAPERRRVQPAPSARRLVGTAIVGAVMLNLDIASVSIVLPTFQAEFGTTVATAAWTMTAYTLALAAVIPFTGWATDRFGARRLYLVALALFGSGALLCGLAWDIGALIGARTLQGLGGGLLVPLAMTITTHAAGPGRVGRVTAVLFATAATGAIAGPILAGWLLGVASWHWVFLAELPLVAVAFAAAYRVLPRDRPQRPAGFDFTGMALLSPGLAALLFAVSSAPGQRSLATAAVLAPAVAGVLLVVAFVRHALRTDHPLIDLRMFRNRELTVAAVTLAMFFVAFTGTGLLLPGYFVMVRGESALAAGLLMAPQSVAGIVTMIVCGRYADRVGPRRLVIGGMTLVVLGMTTLAQVRADTSYALLAGSLAVVGLGLGMTTLPLTAAALASLRHAEVARGSTLITIVQQTGAAVATAVMSVLLTSRLLDVSAADRPAMARAFASTYAVAVALVVLSIVPALFLPRTRRSVLSPPGGAARAAGTVADAGQGVTPEHVRRGRKCLGRRVRPPPARADGAGALQLGERRRQPLEPARAAAVPRRHDTVHAGHPGPADHRCQADGLLGGVQQRHRVQADPGQQHDAVARGQLAQRREHVLTALPAHQRAGQRPDGGERRQRVRAAGPARPREHGPRDGAHAPVDGVPRRVVPAGGRRGRDHAVVLAVVRDRDVPGRRRRGELRTLGGHEHRAAVRQQAVDDGVRSPAHPAERRQRRVQADRPPRQPQPPRRGLHVGRRHRCDHHVTSNPGSMSEGTC